MLKTAKCVRRHPANPLVKPEDMPYEALLAFNAGAAKFNGEYVMAVRICYGTPKEKYQREGGPLKNTLGLARSRDGVNWTPDPEPLFDLDSVLGNAYDPRLTVIDGRVWMCFALDTAQGIRGGVAVSDDLKNFEILSLSAPDNRNMVLFPQRVNGNLVRLERPFPVYGRYDGGKSERFDLWLSESPDGVYWGRTRVVLEAKDAPFGNCKIGPGAPPVLTDKGWLTSFHAVEKVEAPLNAWHSSKWNKIYYAGIMLLDKDDPAKIIGISKEPLLAPETDYELDGYRGSVIFPGGMILEDSGEVKIYYGAADTCECLATARVNDLLALCGQQG
jgi:beta-1,4-mannooligosaccharide/beta-1,4-mannosyl-N-acetylglucosamine phosphorylase